MDTPNEADRYRPGFLSGIRSVRFSMLSRVSPAHLSKSELAKLECANVSELKAVLDSARSVQNMGMVRLVADAALVACAEAYNYLEGEAADKAADAFGDVWAEADDSLTKV
jgi:hypothetical protein